MCEYFFQIFTIGGMEGRKEYHVRLPLAPSPHSHILNYTYMYTAIVLKSNWNLATFQLAKERKAF